MLDRNSLEGLTVVGLGGSLREGSASLAALDFTLEAVRQGGARVIRYSVDELALPLYDESITTPPQALELARAASDADALVWSSPMYHGTVSGAFKNVLDWMQVLAEEDPPFLSNKPIGLIGAAGGVQGLQVINTMQFIAHALRAWTIPFVVPISRAWRAFDEQGRPRDDALARQLSLFAQEVVVAASMFRPGTPKRVAPPSLVLSSPAT